MCVCNIVTYEVHTRHPSTSQHNLFKYVKKGLCTLIILIYIYYFYIFVINSLEKIKLIFKNNCYCMLILFTHPNISCQDLLICLI